MAGRSPHFGRADRRRAAERRSARDAEEADRAARAEEEERQRGARDLLRSVVEEEHELPDGAVLRAITASARKTRVVVEADEDLAVRHLLDLESDGLACECGDADCSGCLSEDDARQAWADAARLTSAGPQGGGRPRYGWYGLPEDWVDACEDEEQLDALLGLIGDGRRTTDRWSTREHLLHGLSIRNAADLVVVDDGQSVWMCSSSEWEAAVDAAVLGRQRIEAGTRDDQDALREWDSQAYTDLCCSVDAIGGATDWEAIRDLVRDKDSELTDDQRAALRRDFVDVDDDDDDDVDDDDSDAVAKAAGET